MFPLLLSSVGMRMPACKSALTLLCAALPACWAAAKTAVPDSVSEIQGKDKSNLQNLQSVWWSGFVASALLRLALWLAPMLAGDAKAKG